MQIAAIEPRRVRQVTVRGSEATKPHMLRRLAHDGAITFDRQLKERAAAGAPSPSASRGPPLAAAVRRRLVGDAAVITAIRHAHHRLAAAEEEIRLSGIPDGPVAFFLIELDQRAALTDRDDVLDQLRLGLEIVFIGGARCERGIAAYRSSHAPEQ